VDSNRHFEDIQGIRAIFAENPMWPSPANVFAIPDDKGFSMIDVGCGGTNSAEHLLGGLDYWGLDLKDLHTVVMSHPHPDHAGAMEWILEEVSPRVLVHHLDAGGTKTPENLIDTFDVPFINKWWAQAVGADSFHELDLLNYFSQMGCAMASTEVVTEICEGDVLDLGDFSFQVIHTPGHSPGHVAFYDKSSGILLSGDMVGESPTWYTPPSGGVVGYLSGLDKLEALDSTIIVPSHGPVIENPGTAIKKMRDRLLERENEILEVLRQGPSTFLELNNQVFKSQSTRFFPGLSATESHLIKLERDGVIKRQRQSVSLIENGK
jgi:glyoxylase-like metal-dependent hydrolase (beta-lactamase superfamily II)